MGLSLGCRSALAPNSNRNRAPETWITAAPQDSITIHSGGDLERPQIKTIPVRFHLYWAGSDIDGAVTGFYWAVVETLPLPPEGSSQLAPLPGPRPSSYRYTSRTDSTFLFKVSEFRPDRQHAFYIYAVDNQGKADPTPARFIFNALDRFPPVPILMVSEARGREAYVSSHGVVAFRDVVTQIRDSLDLKNLGRVPSDTILTGSRIDFRWTSEPRIAGGKATHFKYKLVEPLFIDDPRDTGFVSYNAGLGTAYVPPGLQQFTLRALDEADGAAELTRRFQINKRPDTWFAGPDSNLVAKGGPSDPLPGQRVLSITDWHNLPLLPHSTLSCDSLWYWPSERKEMKTFWEIYQNRLYLRVEGDTVDMNSYVVITNGGSDPDSPYDVLVSRTAPVHDTAVCSAELARVVRPSGPTGSPIGFRVQYSTALDPDYGTVSTRSPSIIYPNFDAASSSIAEYINAYPVVNESGRVYVVARARDGDGLDDDRFPSMAAARTLADNVDFHGDNDPEHLRTRVLTFYVNRSPFLDFSNFLFFPKPPGYNCNNPQYPPPACGDTASSPSRKLSLQLFATDPDPYDPATKPLTGGGPSASSVQRTRVTVIGTYTRDGVTRDTSYTAPRSFAIGQTIDLPVDAPFIASDVVRLVIELCDCTDCEVARGTGRCVVYPPIPVKLPPAAAAASGANSTMTGLRVPDPPIRSVSP